MKLNKQIFLSFTGFFVGYAIMCGGLYLIADCMLLKLPSFLVCLLHVLLLGIVLSLFEMWRQNRKGKRRF